MRSGTKKIVIIGRYKVCPLIPACFISKFQRLLQAAVDIMEKQGGILADRPRMIAAGEMWSGGMNITTVRAGDRLRRLRRFVVRDTPPIGF
jgi:hypothetical protein